MVNGQSTLDGGEETHVPRGGSEDGELGKLRCPPSELLSPGGIPEHRASHIYSKQQKKTDHMNKEDESGHEQEESK